MSAPLAVALPCTAWLVGACALGCASSSSDGAPRDPADAGSESAADASPDGGIPPCPTAPPANDAECVYPDNRICNFSGVTSCLCGLVTAQQQRWTCRTVDATCPKDMPVRAAACSAPALTTCFYEPFTSCTCFDGTWDCRAIGQP